MKSLRTTTGPTILCALVFLALSALFGVTLLNLVVQLQSAAGDRLRNRDAGLFDSGSTRPDESAGESVLPGRG